MLFCSLGLGEMEIRNNLSVRQEVGLDCSENINSLLVLTASYAGDISSHVLALVTVQFFQQFY